VAGEVEVDVVGGEGFERLIESKARIGGEGVAGKMCGDLDLAAGESSEVSDEGFGGAVGEVEEGDAVVAGTGHKSERLVIAGSGAAEGKRGEFEVSVAEFAWAHVGPLGRG